MSSRPTLNELQDHGEFARRHIGPDPGELAVMLATIGVGVWSFFLEVSPFKKDVYIVHFYLGLGTALGILLVHCLIFTYFLGTGRWVKEVGLAYGLPDERWPRQTRASRALAATCFASPTSMPA